MFADKTFQYYKGGGGPVTQIKKGSQTAPVSNSQKGRVRVAAGDKCVAPVKSKPKKRKNLLSNETGGLSMDAVLWSDKSYSVREVVQHYGSKLPVLAKVVEGYAGEVNLQYTMGQVLQLHSFSEQERVRAKSSRGKLLSVPLDYPIICKVLLDNATEQNKLEDAVRKYSLPLKVDILSIANGANTKPYNALGDEWLITDTHEDLYLKVNEINEEGWIEQINVSIAPSFLGLRFAVASGMSGATQEEWTDYHRMFARSVRHIDYTQVKGYNGIVSLSATDCNRIDDQLVVKLSSPNNNTNPSLYQNVVVHESSTSHDQTTTASSGDNRKRNQYENMNPASNNTKHRNLRYGTTESELDVQDMFKDVLKIAEEEEDKRRSQTLGSKPRGKSRPFGALEKGVSTSNIDSEQGVSVMVSRYGKSDSQDSGFRSTSRERLRSGSLSTPRQEDDDTSYNANMRAYQNVKETKARPHVAPKAVVMPTVHNDHPNSFSMVDLSSRNNNNNDVSKKSMTSHYGSVEEIPQDIDKLTIEQVCECLSLLNMDSYIKQFNRQQIDGNLLKGLNESVLQKEFQFTEFNASKLMRFVRGWRPRFS